MYMVQHILCGECHAHLVQQSPDAGSGSRHGGLCVVADHRDELGEVSRGGVERTRALLASRAEQRRPPAARAVAVGQRRGIVSQPS